MITYDDFFTELNKRIFLYVEEAYRNGDVFADANERFTPEEIGRITKIKLDRMELSVNGDSVLLDAIDTLKSSMQKKEAEKATTPEQLSEFINKLRSK